MRGKAWSKKHEGSISFATIPGVDRSSAITILSEIGIDMAQFGSSKRLCCWAGLTPGNNESAGKKKSVRYFPCWVYLKPSLLVQVAHAAVKDKSSTYYAVKYERISKRQGKKRAIIAIARMILTAVYSMFSPAKSGILDLYKVDMPEHLKEQQLAKAIKQATASLKSRDYLLLSSD